MKYLINYTGLPNYFLDTNELTSMEEKFLPALKNRHKRNKLFLLIWNLLIGLMTQMLFLVAYSLAGSIIKVYIEQMFSF